MLAADLIAFEKEVADRFANKELKGPVHLSGGNEEQLIEIWRQIHPEDWIFCSYRYHYHALLHGVPRDELMAHLLGPEPMNFQSAKHRFFTSAIVGGQIPIAVGVAAALKRKNCHRKVWCFLGDMAATTGGYHEARNYAAAHSLPIRFRIEDNGLSCDTPTLDVWNGYFLLDGARYEYQRTYPHVGIGRFIPF